MAVPVLHLNLAPRPSRWRQHHQALGWAALGLGTVALLGSLGLTWRAYHQAGRAGREAVTFAEETRRAAQQEQHLQTSLQDMDAAREQSRWKVAERILLERSLPWSRITAELEQCMVPDMRLKGLQRARSSGQQVVMKLKAEARTQQAEVAFVDALRATPVFAQVILERESERQGGGWDFELSLPAATVPPPFQFKPVKTAPARAAAPAALPAGLRPAIAAPPAAKSGPQGPVPGRPSPALSQGAAAQGAAEKLQVRPAPPTDEEEETRRPRRQPRIPKRPLP
ncbi:hypothetical protein GETHOR_10960 [Geothrix oryzae]|uniref:PilN domain-containing protein n=1 Tax=Geothrix oryzae TaxID=2927975 RepID=A0ABN6UWL7_9BACT|nr:hypothetical protein [Geothrix oryzae]BDU68995.1 hypothetical protein GETHOR_10960 [Geothrix oryzae]